MKKYEHYIGVDVSKKTLDISVLKGKAKLFHLCVSNDEKGLKVLGKKLKDHGVSAKKALLCLENTGLYGWKLAYWSVENQYNVWIENAIAIKRSLGLVRGKNDQIDSERIALYAMRFQDKCTLWQPQREVVIKLKHFFTMRTRLIVSKKRLLTPLKESAPFIAKNHQKELQATCKAALQGVQKSIKEIEKKIDQLIKSDSKLSHMTDIITSIDGIGTQIATAFIVATNEFQQVKKGRGLACYAGVAPFEHSSGTSVSGRSRVSHLANKRLKSIMHMGALSAIKNSEEFQEYYERKVREGKPKLAVINAVKNKQILRMCACVRDDRKYEKNYARKVA